MLILVQSEKELQNHLELTMDLLRHLGFEFQEVPNQLQAPTNHRVLNHHDPLSTKPEGQQGQERCNHLQNRSQATGRL